MVDLDAIRSRAEAATPGPWYVPLYGYSIDTDKKKLLCMMGECVDEQVDADMRFIAAAREDIPALLAEIERLREALKGAHFIANQAGEIIRNSSWIPVSERLPERNIDVLILTDVGIIRKGYIGSKTGHWFSDGFLIVPDVTHWMPLPKPPNTEGKEENDGRP